MERKVETYFHYREWLSENNGNESEDHLFRESRPCTLQRKKSLSDAVHLNYPRKLRFEGAAFDLDGVLTNTAHLHAESWKKALDRFLSDFKEKGTEDKASDKFRPFDIERDYYEFVDGLPRMHGIQSFLNSRGIEVSVGESSDKPFTLSHYGIANSKNDFFINLLQEKGPEVFWDAVDLVKALRKKGVKTALASSSKNVMLVLKLAGLEPLWDFILDGVISEQLGLQGKPNPDVFLECANMLEYPPEKCILFEDAVAGVAAGAAGGFGLVTGVSRENITRRVTEPTEDPKEKMNHRLRLLYAGANIVVSNLTRDSLWFLNDNFPFLDNMWSITFSTPPVSSAEQEKLKEALCVLGNGFFATRGSLLEVLNSSGDENPRKSYPATYIVGGFNRLKSVINGREIENEDLVNFPNFLRITFRTEGEDWFDWEDIQNKWAVDDFRQRIDLRDGLLICSYRIRSLRTGHITTISNQRLVHMKKNSAAAVQYTITPENWSGKIEILSSIEGDVRNAGVARYSKLNGDHLNIIDRGVAYTDDQEKVIHLSARTKQSGLEVVIAARTRYYLGSQAVENDTKILTDREKCIAQTMNIFLKEGSVLVSEKLIALYCNKSPGISNPLEASIQHINRSGPKRFYNEMSLHCLGWKFYWNRFDIEVSTKTLPETGNLLPTASRSFRQKHRVPLLGTENSPKNIRFDSKVEIMRSGNDFESIQYLLDKPEDMSSRIQLIWRFNTFHLLQSYSSNTLSYDASIGARGLHGESYRGHVFWDELFIQPFFLTRMGELVRRMLLYRYYRLPAARDRAKILSCHGACFPWQSGSSGKEETQMIHFNPLSGKWDPDYSNRQFHVNVTIFYNIWRYYLVTGDIDFLKEKGAEMLFEMSRFWGSLATWNPTTARFDLNGVMGPDEYHEKYPDSNEEGLRNNAYTNIMVAWCLEKALTVMKVLPEVVLCENLERLHLRSAEVEKWKLMTRRLTVPFNGAIISQFEGYEKLQEFDWTKYRQKYKDISRLDRILKSEGTSPDHFKVAKQADTCMVFYLLTEEEFISTMHKLGYPFNRQMILKNIDYYLDRTSHGSTLSFVVYSHILFSFRHRLELAWNFYSKFSLCDICDIQGAAAEGIHTAAMAASVTMPIYRFAGIDVTRNAIRFNQPYLPEGLGHLAFKLQFRDQWLHILLTHTTMEVSEISEKTPDPTTLIKIPIIYKDKVFHLKPGSMIQFDLNQTT